MPTTDRAMIAMRTMANLGVGCKRYVGVLPGRIVYGNARKFGLAPSVELAGWARGHIVFVEPLLACYGHYFTTCPSIVDAR